MTGIGGIAIFDFIAIRDGGLQSYGVSLDRKITDAECFQLPTSFCVFLVGCKLFLQVILDDEIQMIRVPHSHGALCRTTVFESAGNPVLPK